MQTSKKIDRVKEILLWIYLAAVVAGTVYGVSRGERAETPGDILYEHSLKQ